MANNHFNDRGPGGINETFVHLKKVGIKSFGLGEIPQTAAKPLLVETPMGVTIGVTGMSQLYYYGEPLGRGQVGVIEPQKKDTAALAVELLHASGADLKVVFVHWGSNYVMDAKKDKLNDTAGSNYVMDPQKDSLDKYAAILADAGFDLIIGSDGSHTAQLFEYVHGVPVLYNIPREIHMETSFCPMAWLCMCLLIRAANFMLWNCIAISLTIDQMDTLRPCTQEEANELFLSLRPHVEHINGGQRKNAKQCLRKWTWPWNVVPPVCSFDATNPFLPAAAGTGVRQECREDNDTTIKGHRMCWLHDMISSAIIIGLRAWKCRK
jgi:hypothetical protein